MLEIYIHLASIDYEPNALKSGGPLMPLFHIVHHYHRAFANGEGLARDFSTQKSKFRGWKRDTSRIFVYEINSRIWMVVMDCISLKGTSSRFFSLFCLSRSCPIHVTIICPMSLNSFS